MSHKQDRYAVILRQTASGSDNWRKIADLAERWHGVISAEQLRSLGVSDRAIRRLVDAGALARRHMGVYSVAGQRLSIRGCARAAMLACGPQARVSHRWAAVLRRYLPPFDGPVDVSASGPRGRRDPAIALHRVAALPPAEPLDGILVTLPGPTLLGVADRYPEQLAQALNEALVLGAVTKAQLLTLIAESPGRKGVARLRLELDGAEPTLSELERKVLRLIRAARLPRPVVNRDAGRRRLDLTWRPERVIVELDGWRAHGTRRRFEGDRARDTALAARGWIVLRFTWARVEREPYAVIAEIAAVLSVRRVNSH